MSYEFHNIKKHTQKQILVCKQDARSMSEFKTKLQLSNLNGLKDYNNDVDTYGSCNTFIDTILDAKQLCLPSKYIKFNKSKHKNCEWITPGLIKSINVRDKIYKKLQSTPVHLLQY